MNSKTCIGKTQERVDGKAFQPRNPVGKDIGLGKFLVHPTNTENLKAVDTS